MDVVLVLAAVIFGALIVLLLVRRWRWRRAPMAFLRTYRASPALQEYAQLRRLYLAGPEVAADRTYGSAADAVVAELGPGFDPRNSAWARLGSLEPDLEAFIGRRFDLSAAEPMDIEAFAEALLLARHMQPRLDSPMAWWASAVGIGLAFAADWRVSQPGRDPGARSYTSDEAFEEAERVMDRFFQSGAWYWDFEHGLAIDPQGHPFPEQAAAPLTVATGAANANRRVIAPSTGLPSLGGSPRPGSGPYQTRADPILQLDACNQIGFQVGFLSAQRPMPDCEDAYVASIVPMDASAWPAEPFPALLATAGTWFERWTLDCVGTRLAFAVAFIPDPKGGTNLTAALIE